MVPPAQLSDDRRYVWDGAAWQPAQYSPDGAHVWDGQAWRPVPPQNAPATIAPQGIAFAFEVGEKEKHNVHFSFDQVGGRVKIDVDGEVVVNELRLISLSTTKRYKFAVGTAERHEVVIEKQRKVLLAGFRPQVCKVYVDGRAAGQYDGTAWLAE